MKIYLPLTLIFCFSLIFLSSKSSNIIPESVDNQSDKDSINSFEKDTITTIGVGDIMFGTNFPSNSYLPPNDGKDLLLPVIDILKDADITFGNCEGSFLDSLGTAKKCNDSTKCYAFRQPTKYVQNYVDAGFDLLSIANNHVGDFGETGRNSTIQTLDSAKLFYAGLSSCPFVLFEKNGVKYGFAAFAPNTGTMSINDIDSAKKITAHLDSLSDIVIISFHGGGEGKSFEHVPKKSEKFYGENRGDVHKFAHSVIDAGADIIFGHGPHVTRAVELYKNRLIAYSLGNFCTYSRFNLGGPAGYAPILKVFTDRQGEFLKGFIFPIKQIGEGGPQLDENNSVVKKIKSLTKKDFPNTPIEISLTGEIKKVPPKTEKQGLKKK